MGRNFSGTPIARMMIALAIFALCFSQFSEGAAAQSTWRVSEFKVAGEIRALFEIKSDSGPQLIAETGTGDFLRITASGEALEATAVTFKRDPRPRRPGMLPDGVVSFGQSQIREAWLTGPTRRYAHGVIGDAIEASGLRVRLADGTILNAILDNRSVFEDRLARLVDLTGNGENEVMVVRSYLNAGAALSIWGVRGGELVRSAEAPAIGSSYRWLNPVGVADFDGDGTLEAAAVITPHIGGILKLYSVVGDNLVEEISVRGFSNHFIGSRELGLSAVIDANEDNIPDIVLPTSNRRGIRIVTFAGHQFAEIANLAVSQSVQTAFAQLPGGGEPNTLVVGLNGGILAYIHR
jgi:hypothetical protein